MQIDIQARDFSLTPALQKYIRRRLGYALGNHEERIQFVRIRLLDINGPRGGNDKLCQIQVVLASLPDVIIDDIEADMYVAIDRASDRASRTVGRRLSRQQDLLRGMSLQR
ncbi:MAG: HPF/RaiA family ribosome-associated protein [Gammaproteobacteria bacterium]|nr:HPF/RaiA family ribosome-associated protein [Gammaproteobacteria bacterium]